MSTIEEYTLTDSTIAQIAKVLQVAILTGTDIVDNLRMARFVLDGNNLEISPNYAKTFNDSLEKLLEEVNQQTDTPDLLDT